MGLRPWRDADRAAGCGLWPVTKTVSLLAVLALSGALLVLVGVGSAAADSAKPTITKDVAAANDGVWADTENVPKTVSYPWTVTYRLTIFGGTAPGPLGSFHEIVSITDSTTSDIGDCQLLVGTIINNNQTVTCTYTETLAEAGTSPFVNAATLTYDSGGNDVASNTATVNFPGMTLDKSSTTTVITASGQVVPYSYLVTNTGTSALTGISLVDDKTDAPPTCPATTLAVGGSMTCSGQHTVTSAELSAGGNLVNIATVSSNEAPDAADSVSIPIVRTPAASGALTMGFWQNKNGQAIISGQAKTGVCASATWLRQYAPFQDLSASAKCTDVASYVSNAIKAADCGGSTCNAMLKAQTLATALDVYFSNPALGGNKLNAATPIGGLTIDLTKICTDIPTCSSFVSASSAFAGATSLTVSQMLAYAGSQSNAGGSTWYGNVKATQVLAKDAFDAINNQVAFTL
jgi:hypothetical protein